MIVTFLTLQITFGCMLWINFNLFLTVMIVVQFISEDQTCDCNPLTLLREREIIILFLTQIFGWKNEISWDLKRLIRRLTPPHSCMCLQREAVPSTTAAWGCFPAVLFGCFQHCGDPSLAQRVVYPKFAFNQEKSQLLLVLYSVHHLPSNHLTANSHYNATTILSLASSFHFSGSKYKTKLGIQTLDIHHARYLHPRM